MSNLLLPAPRIAGLLPAVCPRYVPVRKPDYRAIDTPRIWITTLAGTFAVLDETCVGTALAELAGRAVTEPVLVPGRMALPVAG